MQTLLLQPDDVLFCRDGRPMTGALTGKGDRLPYPHVLHAALHAALHRLEEKPGHVHRIRDRQKNPGERDQLFGSLRSAGLFPVDREGRWYFPTPRDLTMKDSLQPGLLPAEVAGLGGATHNLPAGLRPVLGRMRAEKEGALPWLSSASWAAYLQGKAGPVEFAKDDSFFASESMTGIAIDAATGTTGAGLIYSAERLRLREEVRLGALAEMRNRHLAGQPDDIPLLFPRTGRIRLGGESRTCRVERVEGMTLPLPRSGPMAGTLVKWVLLTPAVFPAGKAEEGRPQHPGGWLPNWVEPEPARDERGGYPVHLLDGPGKAKAERLRVPAGRPIRARLVAAIVPKPVVITGWSLDQNREDRGGAKSTLLAVPAGAVYYFEAEDPDEAVRLAAALNWHGSSGAAGHLLNQRSTLFGEKGYGLGVCAPWTPFLPQT